MINAVFVVPEDEADLVRNMPKREPKIKNMRLTHIFTPYFMHPTHIFIFEAHKE